LKNKHSDKYIGWNKVS